MERFTLKLGVLVPLLYLGAILGAAWFYPGYDHMTQYASELGAAESPRREIFNYAIMAGGGCAVLASIGVFLALSRLSRGVVSATLAAVTLALWGVAMVMGGLYPMPDPRHNAYGLGLAIQLTPLFVLVGLLRYSKLSWLKTLSAIVFLVSAALLAVLMGAGQMANIPQLMVHKADVGVWQRAYAASIIPWIALMSLGLHGAATERIRSATRRETRMALMDIDPPSPGGGAPEGGVPENGDRRAAGPGRPLVL